MVTVVSVLALTATFLLPHLFVAQDIARERGFEDRLKALVMAAEKTAAETSKIATVKVSGQEFRVVTLDENQEEKVVQTESMPSTVQVGSLRVRGEDSTDAEFELNAYPNGKTDTGSIQLSVSGKARSLDVNEYGRLTWRDGAASEQKTSETWEAGSLEQRTG
jgi:hypothetical protein